jgi:hypothetical protein
MTDPVRRSETPKKRPASHRARMRAAGMRPLRIWVPDATGPDFEAKVRRQSRALAKSDPAGDDIMADLEGLREWPEWKE